MFQHILMHTIGELHTMKGRQLNAGAIRMRKPKRSKLQRLEVQEPRVKARLMFIGIVEVYEPVT